jgi:hypothetical protein
MVNFLIKYRLWISAAILLSLLGTIFVLKDGVSFDNSLDIWFVQNDKVYEDYVDFRQRYANDEVVAIYAKSGNFFNIDVINRMDKMCNEIDSLPFVRKVISIANAPYITSTIMGPMVSPLISNAPQSQRDIEILEARIMRIPHFKNTFLDKKCEGFMAYAMLQSPSGKAVDPKTIRDIKNIAFKYFENVHFGGIPVINESLNTTASSESKKLSILSIITVIALLFLFLRSWRYVLISVLSVFIPVIWLFGGFTFWGGSFNMITIVIPTLLLITGTATSIHIVNICHIYSIQSELTPFEALKKALDYVFWPCFFTATTTMAGFASLLASPIEGIKQIGILSSIGVGLVFICSFVVTAMAFILLPPKKHIKSIEIQQFSPKTKSILSFFNKMNKRLPSIPMIIFPATIAISLLLLGKIDVETHTFDYLDRHSAAYIDNQIIEQSVGPYLPVEMLISKDTAFTASELHKIFNFQKALVDSKLIDNVYSPINLMGYLNTVVFNSKQPNLPEGMGSTEWIKNLYLKNRNANFLRYDNDPFSEIRISANTYIQSSKYYERLEDSIHNKFTEIFPERSGICFSMRGYIPMYVSMNRHITQGQIKTFFVAFILILILIVICFKSIKLALIALVPNLFPIALVLIIMAVFGIPIDQGTALITCVILGVAFDDSIHLIYAYRNWKKNGLSSFDATEKGLETTASAMISTSIALFAGFAIIATIGVGGLVSFGLLCAIAVFGSILGNIWLFPLLLKKVK